MPRNGNVRNATYLSRNSPLKRSRGPVHGDLLASALLELTLNILALYGVKCVYEWPISSAVCEILVSGGVRVRLGEEQVRAQINRYVQASEALER